MLTERIGFLTFQQMHSRTNIGSSRLRAQCLIDHWAEAEMFTIGRKYSAVIFQKAYWLDYAVMFPGIKILDVCDPDFLDWNSDCLAMANLCDAVTVSTEPLKEYLAQYTYTPVIVVPDMVDPSFSAVQPKIHTQSRDASIAAWFGYSCNYAVLDDAIPSLVENGISELIVVTDRKVQYTLPVAFEASLTVTQFEWNISSVAELLKRADFVVNFGRNFGKWRYKSNNKTSMAWALGLPVAHNPVEVASLIKGHSRDIESQKRLIEVRDHYKISSSVESYKAIIQQVRRSKTNQGEC